MRLLGLLFLIGCGAHIPGRQAIVPYFPGDGRRCSAVSLGSGMLLTAQHCLLEETPGPDIAMVSVPYSMPSVEIATDLPKKGDPVVISGYGCGYPRLGIRRGWWTGEMSPWHTWVIKGRVCPGDSGGALLDSKGRLLGILVAYSPGLAYVTPLGDLLARLPEVAPSPR